MLVILMLLLQSISSLGVTLAKKTEPDLLRAKELNHFANNRKQPSESGASGPTDTRVHGPPRRHSLDQNGSEESAQMQVSHEGYSVDSTDVTRGRTIASEGETAGIEQCRFLTSSSDENYDEGALCDCVRDYGKSDRSTQWKCTLVLVETQPKRSTEKTELQDHCTADVHSRQQLTQCSSGSEYAENSSSKSAVDITTLLKQLRFSEEFNWYQLHYWRQLYLKFRKAYDIRLEELEEKPPMRLVSSADLLISSWKSTIENYNELLEQSNLAIRQSSNELIALVHRLLAGHEQIHDYLKSMPWVISQWERLEHEHGQWLEKMYNEKVKKGARPIVSIPEEFRRTRENTGFFGGKDENHPAGFFGQDGHTLGTGEAKRMFELERTRAARTRESDHLMTKAQLQALLNKQRGTIENGRLQTRKQAEGRDEGKMAIGSQQTDIENTQQREGEERKSYVWEKKAYDARYKKLANRLSWR